MNIYKQTSESRYFIPLEERHQRAIEGDLDSLQDRLEVLLIPNDYETVKAMFDSSLKNSSLGSQDLIRQWGYKYSITTQKEMPIGRGEKVFTNEDSNGAVAESGASLCSLFILFDDEGQAYIWHVPMSMSVDKPIFEELEVPMMKKFLELGDKLTGKKYLLLTGTNVKNQTRNIIESVAKQESSDRDIQLLTLFSKSDDDQTHQGNMIEGVILIPKIISNSGKTRILLLGHREQ